MARSEKTGYPDCGLNQTVKVFPGDEMKPHLAHINNTLIKKQLAEKAKDTQSTYAQYRSKADQLMQVMPIEDIVSELELEISRIMASNHEGDDIFQQGVHNSKVSCISSIRTLIAELKGEN